MLKPGTDENNVQMSDVLCDFCGRVWTETTPFIEGHRGCVVCGSCLAVGYAEVVAAGRGGATEEYTCSLCREDDQDRAALDRAGEVGWRSPVRAEAVACTRCLTQAADALAADPDHDWTKPAGAG